MSATITIKPSEPTHNVQAARVVEYALNFLLANMDWCCAADMLGEPVDEMTETIFALVEHDVRSVAEGKISTIVINVEDE